MEMMIDNHHRQRVKKPPQTSKIPILDNSYMGIAEKKYIKN